MDEMEGEIMRGKKLLQSEILGESREASLRE